jgi:hypothetical protein
VGGAALSVDASCSVNDVRTFFELVCFASNLNTGSPLIFLSLLMEFITDFKGAVLA